MSVPDVLPDACIAREELMMNGTMNGGSTMWGMGLGGLLILVLVVLSVAALVKYLFFNKRQ